jgi:hypothetical protein
VIALEDQLERMRERMRSLEQRARALEQEMADEVDRVRREFRAEIVPYQSPGEALVPASQVKGFKVKIRRDGDGASPGS